MGNPLDRSWMVGWILTDLMTKGALCQEKLTSRSPFTVNDFGLEK